jgi:meiotic recombination protein SPO11
MSSASASKKRSRDAATAAARLAPADDLDAVMVECRALKAKLRSMADDTSDVEPDAIPSGIVEVDELSATEVLEGIENVALIISQQVMAKQGFSMEIPSRAASNQIYVKEWDRIVLGGKRMERSFTNVKVCTNILNIDSSKNTLVLCAPCFSHVIYCNATTLSLQESRKSAITLRVMQFLYAVLVKRIHITKRDLFYTDVKLFVDQADSDGVLDDVATMIGCTRSNLHVVASDKGLVVGRIQFEEDGDPIDCTRMGVGGKAIPPYIDKIENIQSDAEFVLLIEKEAAYMRLAVSVPILIGSSKFVVVGIVEYESSCCPYRFTFLITGRSFLQQISLHRHNRQRPTRCGDSNVLVSDYGRAENPSPWLGGLRSVRSQNFIRIHVGK